MTSNGTGGEVDGIKAALGVLHATLTKAKTIRTALGRAAEESSTVTAQLEGLRRELVRVSADAATGAAVPPARVSEIRAQIETAEGDADLRAEVWGELVARLEAAEEPLAEAQGALTRALAEEAARLAAEVQAEGRRLLAPLFARVGALQSAGAEAMGLGVAHALAAALGVTIEADPATAEAKQAAQVRAASADLGAALEEIRDARRERARKAHAEREQRTRAGKGA